jgi:hypothetical protein
MGPIIQGMLIGVSGATLYFVVDKYEPDGGCSLLHPLIIDADISQSATIAPEAAPIAAPTNGIRKINPINVPQNVPETAPTAVVLISWSA